MFFLCGEDRGEPDFPVLAGSFDVPAVLFCHGPGNGQAETVMLSVLVPGFVSLVEAVKEMVQLFLRDGSPFIGYGEHRRAPRGPLGRLGNGEGDARRAQRLLRADDPLFLKVLRYSHHIHYYP